MQLDVQWMCLHLRHGAGKGSGGDHSGGSPEDVAAPETGEGDGGSSLRCVQCRHKITDTGSRMEMLGQHRHVFFNPHGHVFELGCFSSAPGCAAIGPSSEEFSWFAGHAWQVAICGRCGLHMGWLFRGVSLSSAFWGLIIPHLVEDKDD